MQYSIPQGTQAVMGIPIGRLNNLERRVAALEAGGTAWSAPPETPNGVIVTFTVGSSAPTDVVSDGQMRFAGIDYNFSAGHITFIGSGPAQLVRYR